MNVLWNLVYLAFAIKMFTYFPQNEIIKLTENIHDHEIFENSYQATIEWIGSCENELKDCNNTKGNGISIQDKLKTLNVSPTRLLYIILLDAFVLP